MTQFILRNNLNLTAIVEFINTCIDEMRVFCTAIASASNGAFAGAPADRAACWSTVSELADSFSLSRRACRSREPGLSWRPLWLLSLIAGDTGGGECFGNAAVVATIGLE